MVSFKPSSYEKGRRTFANMQTALQGVRRASLVSSAAKYRWSSHLFDSYNGVLIKENSKADAVVQAP
jgi:hypothetical protein